METATLLELLEQEDSPICTEAANRIREMRDALIELNVDYDNLNVALDDAIENEKLAVMAANGVDPS